MSSLIDVSTPSAAASVGNGEPRIIHFDATQRRRDMQRQKALHGHADLTPPQTAPETAAPAASSPAAIAPPAQSPAVPAAASAPAVSTQPTPSPSAASSNGAMGRQKLETFLVNFVVEQTGYPTEMVELDADLEADLGIDSIKKAQLFGELAEYFEVEVTDELSLDDFPTLRHVMSFLEGVPQKAAAPSSPPAASPPSPSHSASSTPGPAPAPAAPTVAQPATPVAALNAAGATAVAAAPVKQNGAAAKSSGMAAGELESFLINFVVEQTGYPPEMVELDADLEADLGIDSIKKAQLFGELGEYFEVQPSEDLSLDDFPTLRHVMQFLEGAPRWGDGPPAAAESPGPAFAAAPAPVAATPAPTLTRAPVSQPAAETLEVAPRPASSAPQNGSMDDRDLESFLVNFVVEQTGYPPEMVELDADLEADLGIDSIKKAQLFGELAEYFEVQPSDDLSLDDFPTLRHVMSFLKGVPRRTTTA